MRQAIHAPSVETCACGREERPRALARGARRRESGASCFRACILGGSDGRPRAAATFNWRLWTAPQVIDVVFRVFPLIFLTSTALRRIWARLSLALRINCPRRYGRARWKHRRLEAAIRGVNGRPWRSAGRLRCRCGAPPNWPSSSTSTAPTIRAGGTQPWVGKAPWPLRLRLRKGEPAAVRKRDRSRAAFVRRFDSSLVSG